MSDFHGFPAGTAQFLRGLTRNNNKQWFTAHRGEYEANWLQVATLFVEVAGERLQAIRPQVVADPRVNGSIFRINRDIRFSTDKTPYKDHLDLWFWEGERKSAASGFFFRFTPNSIMAGAGSHGLQRDQLRRFREAVATAPGAQSLAAAVEAVEKAGHAVQGDARVRVPSGYGQLEAEQTRLIKFTTLWAMSEHPGGKWAQQPSVLDWTLKRWKQMLPLHIWLIDNVAG